MLGELREPSSKALKLHEGRLLVCVLAHKNENFIFRKMRGHSKWPLHSRIKEGNDLWCKKFDVLQGKNN